MRRLIAILLILPLAGLVAWTGYEVATRIPLWVSLGLLGALIVASAAYVFLRDGNAPRSGARAARGRPEGRR